jgi:hypothetical protein
VAVGLHCVGFHFLFLYVKENNTVTSVVKHTYLFFVDMPLVLGGR